MKKISSYILLALIVAVLCFVLINRTDDKTDIEKVRQEFRSQFSKVLIELDSVKAELKATKAQVDLIKADTDTLKFGQSLIFDEVKKANDKSFWDLFK